MAEYNVSDSIPIASIHATILAIIAGFVLAYSLYVRATLEQMKTEVFQQASEIANIYFLQDNRQIFMPRNYPHSPVQSAEDLPKLKKPQELLELLEKFGKGEQIPGVDYARQRGYEILRTIFLLTNQPPFVERAKQLTNGGSSVTSEDVYLTFTDLEEAGNWAKKIEPIARGLYWTLRKHKEELQSSLDAYYGHWEQFKKTAAFVRPSVEELVATSQQVRDIAAFVKLRIAQIKSYRENFPRRTLYWFLPSTIIVFLLAVMIPIFLSVYSLQETPGWFLKFCSLWTPIVFYLSASVCLIIHILKLR